MNSPTNNGWKPDIIIMYNDFVDKLRGFSKSLYGLNS